MGYELDSTIIFPFWKHEFKNSELGVDGIHHDQFIYSNLDLDTDSDQVKAMIIKEATMCLAI